MFVQVAFGGTIAQVFLLSAADTPWFVDVELNEDVPRWK